MLIKCCKQTNITGGPPCTTPKATKASRVRGRTFQLPQRGAPPPLIASLRCILRSLVKSPGEFPSGIIEHASSSLLFGLLKWGYIIPNVNFP